MHPPPRREDVRASDVVLAELLNRRPPAAWLAASHDGSAGGKECELVQLVRPAGRAVLPRAVAAALHHAPARSFQGGGACSPQNPSTFTHYRLATASRWTLCW